MPAHKYETSKGIRWLAKFYYEDYEGNTKQKLKRGFKFKREAEEFEREFKTNVSFQPNMSFKAFYELYKKDRNPRLKPTSIQTRDYRVANNIMPFFKDMPLDSITPQIIIQWQNKLIEKGLEPTTQYNQHTALSSIFNHAIRFYRLTENPCLKAGKVGSKTPEAEMLFWTLDEYQSIICEVKDIKAKAAISTLYWSGIRKGELMGLIWSDIDFKSGEMSITKNYQRIKGEGVIQSTKTGVNRSLLLPKIALETLLEYKSQLYKPTTKEPIFDWEKRFIEQGISAACKASNVKRIRVHDIRHSHASLLINLGYSPVLIAKRLGHDKVETTLNTYSHLFPSEETELINELDQISVKK